MAPQPRRRHRGWIIVEKSESGGEDVVSISVTMRRVSEPLVVGHGKDGVDKAIAFFEQALGETIALEDLGKLGYRVSVPEPPERAGLKSVNDIVYAVAEKAKKLADEPIDQLRLAVASMDSTTLSAARRELAGQSRGELMEQILEEEFCEEFPREVTTDD